MRGSDRVLRHRRDGGHALVSCKCCRIRGLVKDVVVDELADCNRVRVVVTLRYSRLGDEEQLTPRHPDNVASRSVFPQHT